MRTSPNLRLCEIEVARLKSRVARAIKPLKKLCVNNGIEVLELNESVWVHKIENNEIVFSKSIKFNADNYQDCLQIYVMNQQLEKIEVIKNYIELNTLQCAA
ncbi:hypothetical protein EC844_12569 [Acinetobacter calcoaceticus]|uniref:Uncharacterized protein n=1 Tax=Acinetobacter calcoaceticus TaxID=471 RepID=A0A4R1XHF3_ACICA|nr:hypothetical protein EC844_12569 [Acinetobacter calcoaceticus]